MKRLLQIDDEPGVTDFIQTVAEELHNSKFRQIPKFRGTLKFQERDTCLTKPDPIQPSRVL